MGTVTGAMGDLVPTRVGMIPVLVAYVVWKISCPHTRGDDPGVVSVLQIPIDLSPHACGDKQLVQLPHLLRLGSSPRVWGQGVAPLGNVHTTGIIPTRVGTRARSDVGLDANGDHPHACGDKDSRNVARCKARGSSPRVWGQVPVKFRNQLFLGIIPTRVGTRQYSLHISTGG